MEILRKLDGVVWGPPTIVLILGMGLYLSVKTRWLQLRLLPRGLGLLFSREGRRAGPGETTPVQALCTALAATVGTGNIAGVAGAICLGGPGAVFWMWMCGLLGMMTKFAEVTLAQRYRVKNDAGEWVGGPMYMIRLGLGKRWQWMAGLYSFFGVAAAFGVGNATQINAVLTAAQVCLGDRLSDRGMTVLALALAAILAGVLLGGVERIGRAAGKLVPAAAALYLLLGLGALILCRERLGEAILMIFQGAFSPQAVTGGMIGSLLPVLRAGIARGVFTNEAGMGTASIAHAAASGAEPMAQGLLGVVEVFVDTLVICTLTALVILCSGVAVPYGADPGAALTAAAFSRVYGDWVKGLLAALIGCFAFATVLGWGVYGIRCVQFLFGSGVWKSFAWLQVGTVLLAAGMKTGGIWLLAEIVNGLMAVPNLIGLGLLSPELFQLIKKSRLPVRGRRDEGQGEGIGERVYPDSPASRLKRRL